jgi:DNA-binding response OmpR family regulator
VIGRRILVVEDEYLVAEDARRWLQGAGAQVIGPTPRVSRAQALIGSERIDAALLDVHVAGELVFPAADALQGRRIPFLFMSGFDRSIVPARFAHIDLLGKPIAVETLLPAMTRLFDR